MTTTSPSWVGWPPGCGPPRPRRAPVDGKDFRPHLSLARLKRPVEATRWLRILDTYDGPSWPVTRFELVASHLHEGPKRRPRHEVVASVRLGLQAL